ncbi:hypothetical protein KGF56_003377 [Candida oxycetoniae]|uniref:Uncharacterized protein n=1 Tax=Candida oxycetoniae TaxID=497107 RepID=A0AAI9WX31_9ASCO|nr:uncharacterized protein KGF56_003377 [Candida oxycetoniae]KAI3403817.2 hypothetical protein KGF56_003377 [Candida oxycetoniae]
MKPIEEYRRNYETPNASLLERKHYIDDLVLKLRDLAKIEELAGSSNQKSKNDYISIMIHHGFYHEIAGLETSDLDLFEQISHFMKLLLEFALKLREAGEKCQDTEYDVIAIGEILGYHLFTFTQPYQHQYQIIGYKLTYLHRFITETLKFCQDFPLQIFQIWLPIDQLNTSLLASNFTNYVNQLASYDDKLPIFNILKSMLLYNHQYQEECCSNWVKLNHLTKKSPELEEYLMNRTDLIEHFLKLYYANLFQSNNNSDPENQKILTRLLLPTMEFCSTDIRHVYYNEIFIKRFEYAMSNYRIDVDKLVNSILTAFQEIDTPEILQQFITNEAMLKYMICKFEKRQLHLNQLLNHLTFIMEKRDPALIELLGIQDHSTNQTLQAMSNVATQTMNIVENNTNIVSSRYKQIIMQHSSAIKANRFDAKLPFSNSFLKLLLQFFHHSPELNESLVHFMSQFVMKFNVLDNPPFMIIITYLYASFDTYQEQWRKFENYRFDSIELKKLQNIPVIIPGDELLKRYDVPSMKYLNYQTLPRNLQLFKSIIIDLYVCCKLRIIIKDQV